MKGLTGIKALLLDLDGTVYRGHTLIKGIRKTIAALEKRGIRILYVTNNSTRTRHEIAEKLMDLGLDVDEKQIYSSGYATARTIREKNPKARVLCISQGGLQKELRAQHIAVVKNEDADIVAVGLDRDLTYEKLATAHRAIEAGARFIASNKDHRFPVEGGFLPGGGAIVAALECSTGIIAQCIGKPERAFATFILAHEKLARKEVLVVGDGMKTDIAWGRNSGLKTVLVLSGVTRTKDIKKSKIRPTYICDSVNEIMDVI